MRTTFSASMPRSARGVLAGMASALLIATVPAPSQALEASDRAEIETIVREYLLANPEVLLEVQQALDAKRAAEQKAAQKATIEKDKERLFSSPDDIVVGNPQGDVTVVEFFDYNCGYCKRALDDMRALLENDDNLRFVLKEFPILGPDSMKAHVVAKAFKKLMPEKYFDFHVALLGGGERATEEHAIAVAVSLGADELKLRTEISMIQPDEAFADAYDLANGLAITGTPSYVVGDEVVFGALGRNHLAEKIDNMRACQSATC